MIKKTGRDLANKTGLNRISRKKYGALFGCIDFYLQKGWSAAEKVSPSCYTVLDFICRKWNIKERNSGIEDTGLVWSVLEGFDVELQRPDPGIIRQGALMLIGLYFAGDSRPPDVVKDELDGKINPCLYYALFSLLDADDSFKGKSILDLLLQNYRDIKQFRPETDLKLICDMIGLKLSSFGAEKSFYGDVFFEDNQKKSAFEEKLVYYAAMIVGLGVSSGVLGRYWNRFGRIKPEDFKSSPEYKADNKKEIKRGVQPAPDHAPSETMKKAEDESGSFPDKENTPVAGSIILVLSSGSVEGLFPDLKLEPEKLNELIDAALYFGCFPREEVAGIMAGMDLFDLPEDYNNINDICLEVEARDLGDLLRGYGQKFSWKKAIRNNPREFILKRVAGTGELKGLEKLGRV